MWWAEVLYPSLLICVSFGALLLVAVGSSYVWLVWLGKRATKCPECGKSGAGELVESTVTDLRARTEWRTRIGLFRQDVSPTQVLEETCEDHFKCCHCGHEWTKTTQWTRRPPERKQASPEEKKARVFPARR